MAHDVDRRALDGVEPCVFGFANLGLQLGDVENGFRECHGFWCGLMKC